jgi:hypothetical protein
MKKIVVLCLLMSLGITSYSQSKKTPAEKAAPTKTEAPKETSTKSDGVTTSDDAKAMDPEEVQTLMMAYMTPGKEHEILASQVGDWKAEITIWTHPRAEPMVNFSKVKIEMILGGRYQQSKYSGEFMGMPFEGVGITAFDNASKKYYSSWIDNMGTGLMFSSGSVDPRTNAIIFSGEQPDPITGKATKIREVLTQTGDSEFTMEMYSTPSGGKEFLSMKIVMRKI